MSLIGKTQFSVPIMNPYVYQASQSVEKDSSLRDFVEQNKEYYISKWGGTPKKETFKKPFNK
jgi:hypothetical protein